VHGEDRSIDGVDKLHHGGGAWRGHERLGLTDTGFHVAADLLDEFFDLSFGDPASREEREDASAVFSAAHVDGEAFIRRVSEGHELLNSGFILPR